MELKNWNRIVLIRVFPGLWGRNLAVSPRFPLQLDLKVGFRSECGEVGYVAASFSEACHDSLRQKSLFSQFRDQKFQSGIVFSELLRLSFGQV